MKLPILQMKLRSADIDATLSMTTSPVGGSFGHVRSCGLKVHQGWDILAPVGTKAFAIDDGTIVGIRNQGDYGLQVLLALSRLKFRSQKLYAFYAHLSHCLVSTMKDAREGEVVGLTGISGNAGGTSPHLHFEIRTDPWPGKGLGGRIDPGEILGYQYYACTP
jgi:murein DD-endopeptidase MepM/ murein hydrolase activator NlpD